MKTEIFKALGDETRLRILNLLLEKPLCVCEIEAILEISQSNVSRHLNKLKIAGIVNTRKDNQWVYYSISKEFSEDNKFLIKYIHSKFTEDQYFSKEREKLKDPRYMNLVCK